MKIEHTGCVHSNKGKLVSGVTFVDRTKWIQRHIRVDALHLDMKYFVLEFSTLVFHTS
jgi:hypothetical protein